MVNPTSRTIEVYVLRDGVYQRMLLKGRVLVTSFVTTLLLREQTLVLVMNDRKRVLTEGEFKLLPPLLADDTIFVPKLKPERRVWRTFMQIVGDVSTLIAVYLLITRLE